MDCINEYTEFCSIVIPQLLTENQRLREALEKIAAQNSGTPGSAKLSDCMAAYARAALEDISKVQNLEIPRESDEGDEQPS